MATVCGASLALMDAGVPLKRPCAGIAMGLIKEDRGFAVLSDILGDEDHLGDMDFKVAGTEQGVTALQMDIKITSITPEIMRIALDQARDGRLHILGEMGKGLTGARGDVAATAPRITVINVPKEKIRDVIGSGGKVIREITEQTGTKIDIEDDGTIKVAATSHRGGADGDRLDPRHRGGAGDRRDLQRQGGEDRRVRRLRQLPRRPRRPRPHLASWRNERVNKHHRRGQCGRRGEGEGHRLRRARQGEALDARGRPGHRRRHHRAGRRPPSARSEGEGGGGGGRDERRAAAATGGDRRW